MTFLSLGQKRGRREGDEGKEEGGVVMTDMEKSTVKRRGRMKGRMRKD